MIEGLPKSLSDQVVGYAASVERALPEIFRDAERKFDQDIANQLVFLAGVRKLHSIVASSYWTLDNSGALLHQFNTERIRVGRADYSRGGLFHQDLLELLEAFENVLSKYNISEYINTSFTELVNILVMNERR